jgi:hypothetical protein
MYRIDNRGNVTTMAPAIRYEPSALVVGADGRFYTSEQSGDFSQTDLVAAFNTNGVATEYTAPGLTGMLTLGRDGAVWFTVVTNGQGSYLGRIDTSGVLTTYNVPKEPFDLTSDKNTNIWYTTNSPDIVEFNTRSQTASAFTTPCRATIYIVAGSDGIYFACEWKMIGKMDFNGNVLATANINEVSTDGEPGKKMIAAPSPRHEIYLAGFGNLFTIEPDLSFHHTRLVRPEGLSFGSDGNVWMSAGVVEVYVLRVLKVSPSSLSLGGPGQSQTIDVHESRYGTNFTAVSSNQLVATVSGSGDVFVVTEVSSGTCVVTVSDKYGNSFDVPVSAN